VRTPLLIILISFLVCGRFEESIAQNNTGTTLLTKGEKSLKNKAYDSASYYFEKALNFHESQSNWETVTECYHYLSQTFWHLNDYEKSLSMTNKALEFYQVKSIKNEMLFILINEQLGITYFSLGNYPSAKIHLDKVWGKKKYSNELQKAEVYERLGYIHKLNDSIDSSFFFFETAISIKVNAFGEHDTKLVNSYISIADNYSVIGESEKAIKFGKKALEITLQGVEKRQEKKLFKIYNTLGIIYYNIRSYSKALDYMNLSLAIHKEKPIVSSDDLYELYNNMALIYSELGNYQKSVEYNRLNLDLLIERFGPSHINVARSYNNLALAYSSVREFDLSTSYYTKAKDILIETLGKDFFRIATINSNIGFNYYSLKNYKEAQSYAEQAIVINEKRFGENHISSVNMRLLLANSLGKQERYQEAIKTHENTLNIYLSQGEEHIRTLFIHNSIGINYEKIKAYEKANAKYDYVLKVIREKFIEQKGNQSIIDPFYLEELMKTYQNKGYILYIQSNNEKAKLLASLSYYQQADSTYEALQSERRNYRGKSDISQSILEVYEEAIQVCKDLYDLGNESSYLELAYRYIEKSKQNTLDENLSDQYAKNYAGLPLELTNLEGELKRERADLKSKIIKFDPGADQADIGKIQKELFKINDTYDSLIQVFEVSYPSYYDLKYSNTIVSVTESQQKLAPDETILNYFIGESNIYLLIVSKSNTAFESLELPGNFQSTLEDFNKSILEKNRKIYVELGQGLCEQLFPQRNNFSGNKVIIMPHRYLWHLNFDLLLSKKVDETADFNNLPYLINDYNIRYANSSTLLYRASNLNNQQESLNGCLAFSFDNLNPSIIKNNENLSFSNLRNDKRDLPGSRKEIKGIANLLDGQYYYGTNASERNFKAQANQYSILHLALHGEIDHKAPENSKLLFTPTKDSTEDNFLHSYEIYELQLKAQLAVLSACNTGSGKLSGGEGIMSLGRAFAYAGVSSLLLTRWEVSDAITPEIMKVFYRELKASKAKSEALRTAKLEFLKNSDNLTSNPFYWSSFYLLGNDTPIEFGSPTPYWIYITGVLVLIFIVFLFFRRRGINLRAKAC